MKPIYVVILVVVVAVAAFYGGMMYQKSQLRASFANGAAGGQFGARFGGQGGGFTGGMMGRSGMTPVRGQIVSQDNNSITVKLQDGSSKIVNLTGQTRINKATAGSVSDLKTGATVTAIGTTNSDGSVTADDVNIGNGTFMRGGGSATQGSPTGSQ